MESRAGVLACGMRFKIANKTFERPDHCITAVTGEPLTKPTEARAALSETALGRSCNSGTACEWLLQGSEHTGQGVQDFECGKELETSWRSGDFVQRFSEYSLGPNTARRLHKQNQAY